MRREQTHLYALYMHLPHSCDYLIPSSMLIENIEGQDYYA